MPKTDHILFPFTIMRFNNNTLVTLTLPKYRNNVCIMSLLVHVMSLPVHVMSLPLYDVTSCL